MSTISVVAITPTPTPGAAVADVQGLPQGVTIKAARITGDQDTGWFWAFNLGGGEPLAVVGNRLTWVLQPTPTPLNPNKSYTARVQTTDGQDVTLPVTAAPPPNPTPTPTPTPGGLTLDLAITITISAADLKKIKDAILAA